MANINKYPLKDFSTSQKFLAGDNTGTTVRVSGQSMLDANIESLKASGKVVNSIDTLTEAIAGNYQSGIYLLVGGGTVTLDGDQAIYRVSDAGSGGIVMANGNELVLLFVANTPANIVTPIADVSQLFGLTGVAGQQISVAGYQVGSIVGGGQMSWGSGIHNGVTRFDPTRAWPNWAVPAEVTAWYLNTGLTVPVWERDNVTELTIEQAGALPSIADNSQAIKAALALFPLVTAGDGTFEIGFNVPIPNQTILKGSGRNRTIIKASAAFSGANVIRLGENTDLEVYGCRVEQMTIDANAASPVALNALYSNSINELSGPRDIHIKAGIETGILIDDADTGSGAGSPKNWSIENYDIVVGNPTLTSNGIVIDSAGHSQGIESGTIWAGMTVANQSGIWVKKGSGHSIINLHTEGAEAGVRIGDAVGGTPVENVTVVNITGPGGNVSVTDLVRIEQASSKNINVFGVKKNLSTNAINDTVLSNVITTSQVASYQTGSGALADRSVTTTDGTILNKLPKTKINQGLISGKVQKSGAYTAKETDRMIEITAGAVSITLPDATTTTDGLELLVVDSSGVGTSSIDITVASGNLIYGAGVGAVGTLTLTANRPYRLVSTSVAPGRWYVTGYT